MNRTSIIPALLVLLLAACVAAGPSWWTALPFVVALPLLVVRIRAEEQLLRTAPEYVDYAQSVRWRLMPGLW